MSFAGGLSYIFVKNGSIGSSATYQEIMDIAEATTWADKDLFVDFGMPSLTPSKPPTLTLPIDKLKEVEILEEFP